MALEDSIDNLDTRIYRLQQLLIKFIEASGFEIVEEDGYETIKKKDNDVADK